MFHCICVCSSFLFDLKKKKNKKKKKKKKKNKIKMNQKNIIKTITQITSDNITFFMVFNLD